ncbi:glutamate decarboxylase gad1 [Basidiobolus ranarum]|uniref:Glutamate decarboxylase gad1 n=1 Tax=Basidiobolus ranarum TaxID=34480 RepID=A0ABR2WNF1_9FUNG
MSKVKANLKWVNGVIQENVGSVIGNEKMEIEGATKRAQGEAEYQKAQSENNPNNENVGKLQANVKWANGAVKENVGNLIGDKELETAGAIERSEGNQEYQRLAQQSDKPIKASDKFNANLKWADGVAKENIGSVTGNTRMQLKLKMT